MLQESIFRTAGIYLEHGKEIRFSLSCNPSTGYEWNVKADDAFTVTQDFILDPAGFEEGMVGVGGTCYFTLKAGEEAGDGSFSLSYERSWEEGNLGDHEFPIHVY